MKRVSSSLVDYDASDEEYDSNEPDPPPKKRQELKFNVYPIELTIVDARKLPQLSTSLTVPVPIDNPSLHQGRVRTHPHVDGQYATHVYISLHLKPRSAMYELLRDVISDAKTSLPSLQEICRFEGDVNNSAKRTELHVSLSRPIYLRAHQREDFKREVRRIAQRNQPFRVSFTNFSELVNDERTRSFLTMEIGAGHHELQSLALALNPILRNLRQKEYYENPRFHASIAWALLDRGSLQPRAAGTRGEASISATDSSSMSGFGENALSNSSTPGPSTDIEFPLIPHFPKTLIPALNERYSKQLISTKVSLFEAENITVKIGKETFLWGLTK